MDSEVLNELTRHPQIWKGCHGAFNCRLVSTGFKDLDKLLKGGWPMGVLCEVLPDSPGIGELSLFLPALSALTDTEDESGSISLINPPWVPYAPGFQQAGVDPNRLLVVQAEGRLDVLWSMEQALASRSCSACFAWVDQASDLALRRLQLAAAEGDSWAVIFRAPEFIKEPSPAAVRFRLSRGSNGLVLDLLRFRGEGPARIQLDIQ